MAAEHLLIDPASALARALGITLSCAQASPFLRPGPASRIGTSRKAFIGWILGTEVDERLEGTAATVAAAIVHGADIVRVHDVLAMARVARMMDAMVRPHFDTHAKGPKAVEPSRAEDEGRRGA